MCLYTHTYTHETCIMKRTRLFHTKLAWRLLRKPRENYSHNKPNSEDTYTKREASANVGAVGVIDNTEIVASSSTTSISIGTNNHMFIYQRNSIIRTKGQKPNTKPQTMKGQCNQLLNSWRLRGRRHGRSPLTRVRFGA